MNAIKKARLAAGLTQTQVAAAIGAAQSWVHKVESGEVKAGNITLDRAVKLARVLGVPVEDLLQDAQ